MSKSTQNASPEEIQEETGQIVAYFERAAANQSPRGQIVHIYNRAIDDAANALATFAKNNPQHAVGLGPAANWLRRNFTLIEETTEPGGPDGDVPFGE